MKKSIYYYSSIFTLLCINEFIGKYLWSGWYSFINTILLLIISTFVFYMIIKDAANYEESNRLGYDKQELAGAIIYTKTIIKKTLKEIIGGKVSLKVLIKNIFLR